MLFKSSSTSVFFLLPSFYFKIISLKFSFIPAHETFYFLLGPPLVLAIVISVSKSESTAAKRDSVCLVIDIDGERGLMSTQLPNHEIV